MTEKISERKHWVIVDNKELEEKGKISVTKKNYLGYLSVEELLN